jgi:hypothetical protein
MVHSDCQEAVEGEWKKEKIDTAVNVNNYEMLATGNSCRSRAIAVIFFAQLAVSSTATASNMTDKENRALCRSNSPAGLAGWWTGQDNTIITQAGMNKTGPLSANMCNEDENACMTRTGRVQCYIRPAALRVQVSAQSRGPRGCGVTTCDIVHAGCRSCTCTLVRRVLLCVCFLIFPFSQISGICHCIF